MKRFSRWTTIALATLVACGAEPPTAPDAVVVPANENPTLLGGVTGRWTRVRYNATGDATLAITNGVATLAFSADFSVEQTPGPFVYINTTNDANTGRPLRVGALKSRRGAQVYSFQVPTGVKYTYILIWCDPFNVPMAEAAIAPIGG
jgi:hypothetical protein